MKQTFFLLISFLLTIKIFSQPVIHSFSPLSGPVGTTVLIEGAGFKAVANENIVYFGAVKAVIQSATDTTLSIVVPAGATFQPVTVTAGNLTAYSVNSFIVTYPGGSGPFNNSSLLPKANLTTGIYPHSVSLSDFNDDGKPDLLVSRGSSSNISVFANTSINGTLSFGPQTDIPGLGSSHEGSATGDLDGDGKPDVVIANSYNTASVSVYRNTSAGSTISFATKIDYPVDKGPYTVAVGDIDGDGKPDLIVAANGSNVVSFYKNNSTPGSISFAERLDFIAGTNTYSVSINDVDGDGKADVIVTTQGSSSGLWIMKNTTDSGKVSLDAPVNYATLSGSFIVSVGDLDGDGLPDLAAASASTNSVVVLKNVSTPGNLTFYSARRFTTGTYPVCVAMGDIDGDGKPDLVTSNQESNNISLLRNISSGGNISFEPHVDYAANERPIFAAVGDLDGDGRPDIVNANSSADVVSVFKNITGTNTAPVINSFTPDSAITGTTVILTGANFNGASSVKFGGVEAASFKVDSSRGITAIVGEGKSGDVSVTTPNGTASLAGFFFEGPAIDNFTPTTGITGTEVIISGSNFSGASEVKFGGTPAASFTIVSINIIKAIVGAGSAGEVSVTTPFGTATLGGFTFGAPTITSIAPQSGHAGAVVTITGTNFNKQPAGNIVFFGAVKAIVSGASSTQLEVIVPAGATYKPVSVTSNRLTAYSSKPFLQTFAGDSNLLSASSFSLVGDFGVGTYPFAIAIADLNDDGKADIATANSVSNSITILKNTSTTGTVSFNTSTDYKTGPDPKRIAIGDLDGDGKPDMVVTNFNAGSAGTISVFRNTSEGGSISFEAKADYATGNGSVDVAIADMNGDGRPDLLVSSGNSGFFSFFKNMSSSAGSILFAAKQDYILRSHPDNITIADIDMDNKPDLITSNFSDNTISIFRNNSTGGSLFFDEKIDYPAGLNPSFITTGDMDGDEKTDIILSNYSSGSISFFRNFSTDGLVSFAPKQDLLTGVSNIAVADLDGDAKPDIFAGRGLNGKASILQNTYSGTGYFSFAPAVDFIASEYDTYVSAGDLDGDGKPELLVANTTANSVSVFKNRIGSPVVSDVSATRAGNGDTVTINGRNFKGTTDVTFGGTPASSFKITSEKQIEAIIGGGASGDIIVTNSAGSDTISGFRFIPVVSRSGPLVFCQDKLVILSSSASKNNQWIKDGQAINGAVGNTFEVKLSGAYSVQTTSNGITTSSDSLMVVNVITIPASVITKEPGNTLVSSASTGNQWYLDQDLIPGAVDQTYLPPTSGSYTVKITSNGCTSDFSVPYNFILTGLINLGDGQYINLYPNPVKDQLNVNWNINGMPLLNMQITDLQGKQMLLKNNLHSGTPVNISQLPTGILLVKIFTDDGEISQTIKIIKH
jgi:hypothetical protein